MIQKKNKTYDEHEEYDHVEQDVMQNADLYPNCHFEIRT